MIGNQTRGERQGFSPTGLPHAVFDGSAKSDLLLGALLSCRDTVNNEARLHLFVLHTAVEKNRRDGPEWACETATQEENRKKAPLPP